MSGAVCVVGSLVFDLVARTPRRPAPGQTVLGTSFEMHLGGKGFNQAVAARREGAEVAMVGRVGADDFGTRLLAHLDGEGISRRHVVADPRCTTGVGLPVIEDATGQNAIVVVPAANHAVGVADVEAAERRIAEAAVVMLQLEIPLPACAAAARIARASKTTTILNPAPAADIPPTLWEGVDILVPNEGELAALAGSTLPAGAAAKSLLADHDLRAVVVTLGADGVLVVTREEEWQLPAHPVTVVDTVAAGDAFCGALAASLARGARLRDGVIRANAAGALACTARGAEPSLPTAAAIDELLATVAA